MLSEFQQAFAEMVASPDWCRKVRQEPSNLRARYTLTDREVQRLIALADHPNMRMNCMLYRANRLAPLALNLPRLCLALGESLGAIATAYWTANPRTDVHFLLESKRFCDFLRGQVASRAIDCNISSVLEEESQLVERRLQASFDTPPKGRTSGDLA
jgi:hypothetical protein